MRANKGGLVLKSAVDSFGLKRGTTCVKHGAQLAGFRIFISDLDVVDLRQTCGRRSFTLSGLSGSLANPGADYFRR